MISKKVKKIFEIGKKDLYSINVNVNLKLEFFKGVCEVIWPLHQTRFSRRDTLDAKPLLL